MDDGLIQGELVTLITQGDELAGRQARGESSRSRERDSEVTGPVPPGDVGFHMVKVKVPVRHDCQRLVRPARCSLPESFGSVPLAAKLPGTAAHPHEVFLPRVGHHTMDAIAEDPSSEYIQVGVQHVPPLAGRRPRVPIHSDHTGSFFRREWARAAEDADPCHPIGMARGKGKRVRATGASAHHWHPLEIEEIEEACKVVGHGSKAAPGQPCRATKPGPVNGKDTEPVLRRRSRQPAARRPLEPQHAPLIWLARPAPSHHSAVPEPQTTGEDPRSGDLIHTGSLPCGPKDVDNTTGLVRGAARAIIRDPAWGAYGVQSGRIFGGSSQPGRRRT